MFSFLKKQNFQNLKAYLPFETDIHSHILPGIDDGAKDIDASIYLINELIKLGVKQSIATPHIIGDLYRNNDITIGASLHLLQNELELRGIDFKVKAAAEYMLDFYFLDLLKNKIPLLTLKENYILTEFSYAERPQKVEDMLFSILTEGYQPILAHPERYSYFHSNVKYYHHLKELGFLLQLNLLSLTGYYGKGVAKVAQYLLKHDLVSFVASDLHHEKHIEGLNNPQSQQIFKEAFKQTKFNLGMIF